MRPTLFLTLAMFFAPHEFAPQQSAPADQNPPAADSQDAAAKAAARKKRFEEEEKRLEQEGQSTSQAPAADSDQSLFVTPAVVNMMVGDIHSFSAFDIDGNTVTSEAEWSLSNSYVADLSNGNGPTIMAKDHGTVTLRARIGGRTAEATITVTTDSQFKPGTILWSAPQVPGFKGSQIVQAVPSANGPDLYCIDKSDDGDTLIRALFSDGRQLWMKHYSITGKPGTIKGAPTRFIAH
ncbi:MAG: hypothetical protein WA817_22270 [Candidatus Acidiferrum sp.]